MSNVTQVLPTKSQALDVLETLSVKALANLGPHILAQMQVEANLAGRSVLAGNIQLAINTFVRKTAGLHAAVGPTPLERLFNIFRS